MSVALFILWLLVFYFRKIFLFHWTETKWGPQNGYICAPWTHSGLFYSRNLSIKILISSFMLFYKFIWNPVFIRVFKHNTQYFYPFHRTLHEYSLNAYLIYTHQLMHLYTIIFKKFRTYIKTIKTLLHISIIQSSSGSTYCSMLKLCNKTISNVLRYLTLILLTWRIWWASNNATKWQMGFNSAFKGLNLVMWQHVLYLLCASYDTRTDTRHAATSPSLNNEVHHWLF